VQLDEFLDRLDGVRSMGDCPAKFAARCPAHSDRIGSAVITDGQDKILFTCHAGCSVGQVVECLGLVEGDLFYGGRVVGPGGRVNIGGVTPSTVRPGGSAVASVVRGRPAGGMNLEAPVLEAWTRDLTDDVALRLGELKGWSLRTVRELGLALIPGPRPEVARLGLMNFDADGRVFCYVRYQPNKDVLRSSYPKCLAVGPRELYPSPELLPESDVVWLVEGEPDRVSAFEIGLNACAVPGVATWKAGWAERFRGRRVVVCFDCDEPGRSAAATRVVQLAEAGVDVAAVDLFPGRSDGYDVGDALVAAREDGRVDDLRRYLMRLEDEAWRRAA
jgi:hypothetical protein